MEHRYFGIMTLAVLASGVALVSGTVVAVAGPVQLNADQVDVIEQTVKSLLQDPTTASFGKPGAATTPAGAIMVCGRYDAKSGFVGNSGQTAYMGQFDSADIGTEHLPAFDILNMPENQAETDDLVKLCASSGIDMPPPAGK
jgi:hypothetical protein